MTLRTENVLENEWIVIIDEEVKQGMNTCYIIDECHHNTHTHTHVNTTLTSIENEKLT